MERVIAAILQGFETPNVSTVIINPYRFAAPAGGAHRYWRVEGTLPAGGWDMYFIGPKVSTDGSGASIATVSNVSASSELDGVNVASLAAVDDGGNWRTDQATGTSGWWQVDLGSGNSSEVHSVVERHRIDGANGRFPSTVNLQYSDNGSSWTTQSSYNPADDGSTQTFTNL